MDAIAVVQRSQPPREPNSAWTMKQRGQRYCDWKLLPRQVRVSAGTCIEDSSAANVRVISPWVSLGPDMHGRSPTAAHLSPSLRASLVP